MSFINDKHMKCKKVSFVDEKQALLYIEKLHKTSTRKKKPVRAYLCQYCLTWHLTSIQNDNEKELETLNSLLRDKNKEIEALKLQLDSLQNTVKMYQENKGGDINFLNHTIQSYQSRFKSNVQFIKSSEGKLITVIAKTEHGDFIGEGMTLKAAKMDAILKLDQFLNIV